ncbi:MAG: riboflavin biosynthesis protein RibF [Clostridia bacterium]|nr:riboflavin biosynthesis protein RibF [Clostridia bacterium]
MSERDHRPRVIALGTFDGVHRGHQELIRQGKKLAEETGAVLRVCTFDRHPMEILRPEAAPGRLTDSVEQARRLRAFGAEEIRVIPFTRETAGTEPEDFLRSLRETNRITALVAGWNYTFGRKGRGTAETLEADGRAHGYRVIIVPPVTTAEGTVISSTEIRERLAAGDLDGANGMLGSPYTIRGQVTHGTHRGTGMGSPTANIRPEEKKCLPAYGVYIGRLKTGEGTRKALVNIGVQPTMPSGEVKVEAWALDLPPETDLYDEEAEVELLRRLRPEIRFPDPAALAAQIARDRQEAERFFANEKGPGV